jgi:transposase-like protein
MQARPELCDKAFPARVSGGKRLFGNTKSSRSRATSKTGIRTGPRRVSTSLGHHRECLPKSNSLTIELAIPELRAGSYFPGFLEHRRRAERALASVVATSYLLGVSTRRVEKLAASLGVTGLSKSQVGAMAAELDDLVDGFRNRPLDRGPYTFCWIDALTPEDP